MIGVLADDFTGAAETAGAAFAAGYSAEVQTAFDPSTDADVVAVDTDTRSRANAPAASTGAVFGAPASAAGSAAASAVASDAAAAAASAVSAAAEQMRRSGPDRIFKKIDSLLRGNVAAEVDAVRRVFGFDRALVVPANPEIGRTIRQGRYMIADVPLAESALAADPEQPRTTSDVARLLGLDSLSRISVPDAASVDDLRRLAEEVDVDVLPAGSAAFFEAMLRFWGRSSDSSARNDHSRPPDDIAGGRRQDIHPNHLFVCGSLAAWRGGRADEAARRGIPVFAFPAALLEDRAVDDEIEAFAREIEAFAREIQVQPRRSREGSILIAIGRSERVTDVAPQTLTERLAMVSERLLPGFSSVFVEGGASSSALVRRMGWTRLRVVGNPAPGVVTLAPHGGALWAPDRQRGASGRPTLTVKVGSYAWPDAVWAKRH